MCWTPCFISNTRCIAECGRFRRPSTVRAVELSMNLCSRHGKMVVALDRSVSMGRLRILLAWTQPLDTSWIGLVWILGVTAVRQFRKDMRGGVISRSREVLIAMNLIWMAVWRYRAMLIDL